ncbi:MAG TPA: AI-2E family transporter [Solirubrobacteraceae bacterium]|nr:AI-2E family transporter [Solirubrobacteraceae bacterium]
MLGDRLRGAPAQDPPPPAETSQEPSPPAEPSPRAEPEPEPEPMPVPPAVVPRWIQLVLLPLAILGLWELVRATGPVLLIVIFAGVMALILNPPIKRLERRGVPRGLAIPLMYLSVVAVIGAVGVLLSNPVATQVSHFQNDIPSIVHNANHELGSLQTWLDHRGIHIHIQKQGQTALQTLAKSIGKRSGDIVSFSSNLLQKVAAISFGLILSLVLSIYFLIYSELIGNLVRRVMPPGDGTREDDFPYRVQRAVLGYVRGQLLFSLLMGASATIALWIFGIVGIFPAGQHYAVFFGVFYGLMELIPYVGPFLGALPPVVVALLDRPITALWVSILFVVLQQLEGHLVAPQVFRISLRINPILVILALLIGDELYGIAGALLALPVASVLRETVVYLRRHLVLEPWTTAVAGAVGPVRAVGPVGAVGGGAGGGPRAGAGARADDAPERAGPDVAERAGPDVAAPARPAAPAPAGPEVAEPAGPDAPAEPLAAGPDRCPDCDTPAGPGDAFCRACGSSLESGVRTPG